MAPAAVVLAGVREKCIYDEMCEITVKFAYTGGLLNFLR